MSTAAGGVEFVDVFGVGELAGAELTSSDPVPAGSDGRWWVLAAVVGAIALGGLLTRSPDDPRMAEVAVASTTTSEPATSEPTDTDDGLPGGTPSEEAASMRAEALQILTGDPASPPTTVELDRAYHVSVPGRPPVGPVLAGPVGYTLFVGDSTLYRIDLDIGEITEYDVRGRPVHVDDQWLVLARNDGGMHVVPRDDPEGEARRLDLGVDAGHLVPGPEPGTVWVLMFPAGQRTLEWQAVSLIDGSVVASIPTGGWFFSQLPGPTVTSSQGGGVFVLGEEGYRRVAEGIPLAGSDRSVLVRSCSSPVECEIVLLDQLDGSRLDRWLPDVGLDDWAFRLSMADRLLTVSGESFRLFDLTTRTEIVNDPVVAEHMVAFSPEGRLAAVVGSDLQIYDAETATLATVELRGPLSGAVAVFAPE